MIPEFDFEMQSGSIGGKFTTVEGLLVSIKDEVSDHHSVDHRLLFIIISILFNVLIILLIITNFLQLVRSVVQNKLLYTIYLITIFCLQTIQEQLSPFQFLIIVLNPLIF